ncbi:MAG TPA: anhydro-N-acetylmuramic acid kinase [Planctomycetota bacterium]|nr:anhydro-N-acetylmuramic acid kinase [Planctomycetota bacterium]
MKRLIELYQKPVRRIVGLMSGTSVDGIDAALVEVEGAGPGTGVELRAFRTYPFSSDTRERIHRAFSAGTAKELCELNFILGEAFAAAVLKIIQEAGMRIEDVDLVGSHGQTVFHIPKAMRGVNSTLQIGEGAVIAERTGLPVVCDFRPRDIAAGGDGAPLVPYADWVLFSQPGKVRALQNIGGIANVTLLSGTIDDVFAFDTGPGNMIVDHVARAVAADETAFDEDGKLSALGEVDAELLGRLLDHDYLALPPPKTTGREMFGREFSQKLVDEYDPMRLLDLLATVVRFTADSIARAYRDFIFPRFKVDEVIVSGGGVHNLTLLGRLREALAPVPVRTLEDLGLSSDAKEAVAFAILANETIAGHPSNVPSATGALRPVVLGKIVPP